jgi:hypothetical protein
MANGERKKPTKSTIVSGMIGSALDREGPAKASPGDLLGDAVVLARLKSHPGSEVDPVSTLKN